MRVRATRVGTHVDAALTCEYVKTKERFFNEAAAGYDGIDEYLSTKHLSGDLKARAIRGGALTILTQGLKFVLQMVSLAILGRLLDPGAFGLIAMVTAVTGFFAMFKDAGLSLATIQRAEITHAQVSTLFWINVALSVGLGFLTAALAPVLVWIYGEPRLLWITVALSASFLFGGLSVQHQALLRRQMRFADLAVLEVLSLFFSIVVGVLGAFLGLEYWALVLMQISGTLFSCLGSWCSCRWRPSRPKKRTGVKPMLAFGGNASAASFLNYLGANIDKVLIGGAFGSATLGLYERAHKLIQLPIRQMNAPLSAVAVPALSRAVARGERYRLAYISVVERILLFMGIAVAFAISCSDWLIVVVLGPKWIEAASIFRVLAFASLLLPIWNATGWLFSSQDRMREHLYFHLVDSPLKILSVVIGLQWGVLGVSVAVAIRYYLVVPFLFWIVGRRGPVSTLDLYRLLSLPAFIICMNLVALFCLRTFLLDGQNPVLGIGVCLLGSMMVSSACLGLAPYGRRVVRESLSDLRALRKSRNSSRYA